MEQENMEREGIAQYERPELTDLGEFGDETGLSFGFYVEFFLPFPVTWTGL